MSHHVASEHERPPALLLGPDAGNGGATGGGAAPHEDAESDGLPRILLVEDDPGNCEAMRIALDGEGFQVLCAQNGREALDVLLSGRRPDLIVLDLRMPIMDGWEFRAAQKNEPDLGSIPVVAISADGSAKAAAIDADAYLQKPLSTDVLVETVDRLLTEVAHERLKRRLEYDERFAALGRLAASVAQEIKSPLGSLTLNVDVVARDLHRMARASANGGAAPNREDFDDLSDLLEACRGGLGRIRDVVSNLQSLSSTPDRVGDWVSLRDVLDRAVALGRDKVEGRATLVLSYAELPPVFGDASALCQAFVNLLASAADGLIQGDAARNQVVIRAHARGAEVVVEVVDTGPPIPAEVLPYLFEPVFATRVLGEGTGLRLSTSGRIVLDHGGRIEALNNPGRGATFRVTLPTTRDKHATAAGPAAEPIAAEGDRVRVLVIEREPALTRTIERALSGEYEVVSVVAPNQAFSRLSAGERFDLVLCDLVTPHMSGREVYEHLLADWPRVARNLVFMTRGPLDAHAREFVKRTCRRVLFTPFAADELRAIVRAQLDDQVERRN